MSDNESLRSYWWDRPETNVHETLFEVVRFLRRNQSYKRDANLRHMRLYGNVNVLGLTAGTYAQSSNQTDRVTLNIIQSMCDTVTQKIAKNRPKPTFVTSGGDYTQQKKAKLLEKFVQGQFYATDFYQKSPDAFRHGTILGTGSLKIYRQGNEIAVDTAFYDELIVDDIEAIYGEPRNLYQTKIYPKEVLVKLYPKFKDKIMNAKRAENVAQIHESLSNPVEVLEAWHLASAKGAKDGRHVICIENEVLLSEVYTRDYFPFVFSRWLKRLLGFDGQGLAEQLTGLQIEINKILRTIQLSMHLCSIPRYWVEFGSQVVKAHINNEIGGIGYYKGVKPELQALNSVPPELFSHLERLYQKAYEIAGVSQLAAHSEKPGGLDSGKALRTFNDIESERFILAGQAYEQLHMDAAKQMIDLGKEIHEDLKKDGGYKVRVRGKKFLETINWADIDLDEDEYIMQIFPTSMLSSTPAGRLQDVQDLMQAGIIDKANGLRLLDFPDLEQYMSLANAPIEDIENTIEMIIDKGDYQTPEPYMALAMGLQMMQSAYLKAKTDKVEESKLELLRRWMSEAKALIDQGTPPPQPQGMPGGQPQAVPQAPPTSALLPNAPGGAA